VLLLAAVIRLPTLTWHSLDGDEGASLYFSDLPYAELLTHFADLSIDRHPMLYYILLKAWRQIAGDTDVMLRLPSALIGILTVALVYQLGRRRLGETTAGFAALLIALNPLVVFQHQNVRMYAPALLFTVLAVWALWDILDKPRSRIGLKLGVFLFALTFAVYTHLIAALLFPVLSLMLIWEFRRVRRVAIWGMGMLAASALSCMPYLMNILRTDSSGSGGATLDDWLRTTLGAARTLLDFQTTLNVPDSILLGLLGVIVVLGVWRGRREGAMLALWFLLVLAITIFVTLRIDFFQTKVFVFSAVPLALLIALVCLGKSRTLNRRGAIPALVMLSLTLYGLSFQWRAGNQREDFRNAARFVQAQATANDIVVMHLAWYRFVFGHYYPAPFVHPFANNVDSTTPIEQVLRPYLDSEVLWLVQAGAAWGLQESGGDPGGVVQRWLAEHYPIVTEVSPSGVDVRGYATLYRFPSLPDSATPLRIVYPNGLILTGYRLAQRDLPSRDLWLHPPSTWVPITLYWSVIQPLGADIRISILLEDEQGNVWGGELSREKDVRAFYPPLDWQPTEIVRWDFDVNVNPQTPPGEYKVVVRVYETESGVILAHTEGQDWLILDRIRLK